MICSFQLNGKRARGRQKEKMLDGLGRWLGGGKKIDLIVKMLREIYEEERGHQHQQSY